MLHLPSHLNWNLSQLYHNCNNCLSAQYSSCYNSANSLSCPRLTIPNLLIGLEWRKPTACHQGCRARHFAEDDLGYPHSCIHHRAHCTLVYRKTQVEHQPNSLPAPRTRDNSNRVTTGKYSSLEEASSQTIALSVAALHSFGKWACMACWIKLNAGIAYTR